VRLNAPGTTSAGALAMLAAAGATQVEPGHGLTGTTPLHAVRDEPELPAALYISEVSHHHGGRAYCFGGGFYIDPVFPAYPVQALVARDGDLDSAVRVRADLPPPAMIDYYGMLDQPAGRTLEPGSSAVFGFRIQAFFARAPVVGLRGVAAGGAQVA
jgi:predicted amino acid racemase